MNYARDIRMMIEGIHESLDRADRCIMISQNSETPLFLQFPIHSASAADYAAPETFRGQVDLLVCCNNMMVSVT